MPRRCVRPYVTSLRLPFMEVGRRSNPQSRRCFNHGIIMIVIQYFYFAHYNQAVGAFVSK